MLVADLAFVTYQMYAMVRDAMLEEIANVPGIWDDCSELAVLGVRFELGLRLLSKELLLGARTFFGRPKLMHHCWCDHRVFKSTVLRAAMHSNRLCSRQRRKRARQQIYTPRHLETSRT